MLHELDLTLILIVNVVTEIDMIDVQGWDDGGHLEDNHDSLRG